MVAKFVVFLAFLALTQAGLVRRGVHDTEYLMLQQMANEYQNVEKDLYEHKTDPELIKKKNQLEASMREIASTLRGADAATTRQ